MKCCGREVETGSGRGRRLVLWSEEVLE
jgi:hypothetical protein